MRLLINAVGKRKQLISFFKSISEKSNNIEILLADASQNVPAAYGYPLIQTPLMDDDCYDEKYREIFEDNKITHVMTLIDTDAIYLKRVAENNHVTFMGPSERILEICKDKFLFWQELVAAGISTVFTSLEPINQGVFISKDRTGSCGSNFMVHTDQVDSLSNFLDERVFQPFIEGAHVDIDFYSDGDKFLHTQRLVEYKQRGESYVLSSIYESDIDKLIKNFVDYFDYRGVGNADVWLHNNKWILMEVNPRFGGNYPASHISGCDFISNILGMSITDDHCLREKRNIFIKSLIIEKVLNEEVL